MQQSSADYESKILIFKIFFLKKPKNPKILTFKLFMFFL